MKKLTGLTVLLFIVLQHTNAQNIGIGTTSPLAKLDVNGDIAFRSADITITATYNYAVDVNTVKQSNYKLKAAPALGNFIIAGITAGVTGRTITLTNRTGSSMEIYNEDATATALNRIQTGTGSTIAVYPNGNVTLQYDAADQRWAIKSLHNNSLNYFGGGGGTSSWDIAGTNIRNNNTGNVGIGTSPVHSRLEINGKVGSSVALFGADAFGVGISANNPEIGFNYFYNNGTKTIKAGYGANFGMDPSNGNVYLGNFTGNQSATDFGSITGYQNVMTVSQSGNVGIGNPSPLYKLDVVGQTMLKGIPLSSPGNLGYLTGGGFLFLANSSNDGYSLHMDAGKIQAQKPKGIGVSGTNAAILAINPYGGNVGIGLTNPRCRLTILSNTVAGNNNTEVLQVAGKNPMLIISDQNGSDFGYIKGVTDRTQTSQFSREGIEIGTGGGDIYFTSLGYQPALMINGTTNNVGIGTNNPTSKLSVNGNIRSKEVVVELANWPDYVFNEKYKLKSLAEVEDFIKQHNHLPNIPAAAEIEKNGLKVGELQTKMMEKIEELTLYIIEMKKEIDLLKNKGK